MVGRLPSPRRFHVKHATERSHGPPRSSLPTPTRQQGSGGGTRAKPHDRPRYGHTCLQPGPVHVGDPSPAAPQTDVQGRCGAGTQVGDTRLDRTRRHSACQLPEQGSRIFAVSREMRAEPMDRPPASSSGHFSGRSRADEATSRRASTGTSQLCPPRARLTPAPAMWRPFILW